MAIPNYDYQNEFNQDMRKIGKGIKVLREMHGISQKEMDVSAYVIGGLENGFANIKLDTLHRIAKTFGMSMAELLVFCDKAESIQV